ncbi:MAG: Uma2 family endonuclease, partial [Lachnospiraceae bacterium]|nr:Uma2 family endonuclease [Lachnospiraceae bacterium]
ISRYILDNKGDCEVFPAPFAVYLSENRNTYVEPDLSVICDKNKIDENGCKGAPDWVIEIVSPGSRRMDYFIKLFQYRSEGVREYWIIDYEKNKITVWDFSAEDTTEYSFSDRVKVGIYEEFSIDFSQLIL